MDGEQVEYDIYYQGSQSQLYALLYPLTGPDSPTLSSLEEQRITFDTNSKQLEFNYKTRNFENLDKKDASLKYSSQRVPCQSNYFYSTFNPSTQSFVWANIDGFLELRPNNHSANAERSQSTKQLSKIQQSKKSSKPQSGNLKKDELQFEDKVEITSPVVDLNVKQAGDLGNATQTEIKEASYKAGSELKQLWECSKQEYFSYIAK